MYLRYAERRGWSTEILDAVDAELGGYKDVAVAVKSRTDEGIWSRLKFEGGVHRVQRVPVTESQGRIHTSAAGVLVLPRPRRSTSASTRTTCASTSSAPSGPGGQSVNTTDSAVRITHLPSGIVVSSQNEKSQLQNRESALRVLRSGCWPPPARRPRHRQRPAAQPGADDGPQRAGAHLQLPENRIADHRVGYKAHNLDQVIDGDLDAVIDALSRRTPPSCWRPAPERPRAAADAAAG
jgi:peptide chain release factor 1